jgi:hypothetical protein
MIALINDGDLNGGAFEFLSRGEAAESRAHDHHMMQ